MVGNSASKPLEQLPATCCVLSVWIPILGYHQYLFQLQGGHQTFGLFTFKKLLDSKGHSLETVPAKLTVKRCQMLTVLVKWYLPVAMVCI